MCVCGICSLFFEFLFFSFLYYLLLFFLLFYLFPIILHRFRISSLVSSLFPLVSIPLSVSLTLSLYSAFRVFSFELLSVHRL